MVVGEAGGPQRVYTLQTADRPYRVLIEEIQEGAVTLNEEGTILYCNRALAGILRTPLERVIGAQLADFVPGEGAGNPGAASGARRPGRLDLARGRWRSGAHPPFAERAAGGRQSVMPRAPVRRCRRPDRARGPRPGAGGCLRTPLARGRGTRARRGAAASGTEDGGPWAARRRRGA